MGSVLEFLKILDAEGTFNVGILVVFSLGCTAGMVLMRFLNARIVELAKAEEKTARSELETCRKTYAQVERERDAADTRANRAQAAVDATTRQSAAMASTHANAMADLKARLEHAAIDFAMATGKAGGVVTSHRFNDDVRLTINNFGTGPVQLTGDMHRIGTPQGQRERFEIVAKGPFPAKT